MQTIKFFSIQMKFIQCLFFWKPRLIIIFLSLAHQMFQESPPAPSNSPKSLQTLWLWPGVLQRKMAAPWWHPTLLSNQVTTAGAGSRQELWRPAPPYWQPRIWRKRRNTSLECVPTMRLGLASLWSQTMSPHKDSLVSIFVKTYSQAWYLQVERI